MAKKPTTAPKPAATPKPAAPTPEKPGHVPAPNY